MAIEFKLPDLGEGIHEAEIIAVKVSQGQAVKEDQPILEVETDKAVVEIPSPFAGTIDKVFVKAGDIVTVGSVMISFNLESAAKAKTVATGLSSSNQGSATASSGQQSPAGSNGNGARPSAARPVPAAPATRRMARELGVDLHQVHGSGPAGRVLKEDVRAFAEGVPQGTAAARGNSARSTVDPKAEPLPAQPLVSQPVELPDFSRFGPIERVPMRSIRRKIALNMAQSWSHIPHVTHFDEADVSDLEEFRSRHEAEVAASGGKLTLTVFMLKAVALALKKFPQFNSSLDESTGEIVYKHYYNIGVAVATERGLIVPVIANVDKKSLLEISSELAEMAARTREGKIDLAKLQGGTFTITNIGAIGGTGMVPMVNFPEAAILGMARAVQKPVVRDQDITVRLIMPLALSFDHRLADGAEAAYFVRQIANSMEEPLKMLLEA